MNAEVLLALVAGVLSAAGIYMILRRSLLKVILGIAMLAQAVNLLIFTAGGLTVGAPALIPADGRGLTPPFADPVPHALILTAIVIGFGLQAFALVLVKRYFQETGSDDGDTLGTAEEKE